MIDEDKKREFSLEGRKVEYCSPDEIYRCLPKIPKEDIEVSLRVIHQFKEQAQAQKAKLEESIAKLEKIIATPYTRSKEKPYYLHAILIHDGLAENGHYFSYVFDRSTS
mmetsp:Transcript_31698/g.48550  ORF Transcript_31698/g.48550 Transcript_31698/m.48550 type:complete len:109 (+) Transcript_31698:1845-2171(+)